VPCRRGTSRGRCARAPRLNAGGKPPLQPPRPLELSAHGPQGLPEGWDQGHSPAAATSGRCQPSRVQVMKERQPATDMPLQTAFGHVSMACAIVPEMLGRSGSLYELCHPLVDDQRPN
jgi:hypothetical protein